MLKVIVGVYLAVRASSLSDLQGGTRASKPTDWAESGSPAAPVTVLFGTFGTERRLAQECRRCHSALHERAPATAVRSG